MANGESTVQREAAVLSWNALNEEQKQAGRQAHRLLIDMAESDEKIDKPQPRFLPRLDPARTSRVLLIDGGRGSGKTALLLTILAHWRRAFLERPKPKKDEGEDDPPPGRLREPSEEGRDRRHGSGARRRRAVVEVTESRVLARTGAHVELA